MKISESKRKIIPRKLLGKRNFYYSVNPLSVKQPKRLQGKRKYLGKKNNFPCFFFHFWGLRKFLQNYRKTAERETLGEFKMIKILCLKR